MRMWLTQCHIWCAAKIWKHFILSNYNYKINLFKFNSFKKIYYCIHIVSFEPRAQLVYLLYSILDELLVWWINQSANVWGLAVMFGGERTNRSHPSMLILRHSCGLSSSTQNYKNHHDSSPGTSRYNCPEPRLISPHPRCHRRPHPRGCR